MRTLTIELRGEQVTISDVQIGRADRSVGIMCDYLEGYVVTRPDGTPADLDSLTDAETHHIEDTIMSAIHDDDCEEADDTYGGSGKLGDEGDDR